MSEFSPSEIEEMLHAISQNPPPREDSAKIPLLPPGAYKSLSKVIFSPIEGEKPRPITDLTEKEIHHFENLKVQIEVSFGKTRLSLKELAGLKEGSLLPLNTFCDEPVDVYINGVLKARGEVIAVDGKFAVKILSFTKN